MSDVRLVPAPISLSYELKSAYENEFEREFDQLSESDEDPIGQWLRLAKARGETSESDPILLNLMVELYRKIEKIEQILTMSVPARLTLANNAQIESIGFEHFKLTENVLIPGEMYYGRVEMPVHPKRELPMFFIAQRSDLAQIVQLHERNEKEWATYMTARERIMIRQMKGRE